MFEEFESIDNIKLIRNNIRHIQFELDSEKACLVRIAKESHHLLLRFMVEALRGSANIRITGQRRGQRRCRYKRRDGSWKLIQKESIHGCERAWRFSEPICIHLPSESKDNRSDNVVFNNHLVGFYDLLAMIQAEPFMSRLLHSKPISISDSDMRLLEWLHEEIRNEFEHFVPKILLASSEDCLKASDVCLKTAIDLLDSRSITVFDVTEEKNYTNCFRTELRSLQSCLRSL